MEQDESWDETAAAQYDTPGEGMFAPEVLGPTVDFLAELAGGCPVLELAIGTGRVGIPLRERGGRRHRAVRADGRPPAREGEPRGSAGDRWRHGDDAGRRGVRARLPRLQHHLAPAHPGRPGRVLPQRRSAPVARRAVRRRALGAAAAAAAARLPAAVFAAEQGYLGLDTYDTVGQQVVSHHVRFGRGREATHAISPHRYVWPAELDLMGRLAGFELEARYADWDRYEFTAESRSHVSVYRLPSAAHPGVESPGSPGQS